MTPRTSETLPHACPSQATDPKPSTQPNLGAEAVQTTTPQSSAASTDDVAPASFERKRVAIPVGQHRTLMRIGSWDIIDAMPTGSIIKPSQVLSDPIDFLQTVIMLILVSLQAWCIFYSGVGEGGGFYQP
jgi:hypothetical protein